MTSARPKKLLPITALEVIAHDHGKISAGCELEGLRYHVWLDNADPRKLAEPLVYKNPPRGTLSHEKGYFTTRRLPAESGRGGQIAAAIMAGVPALLAQAVAERDARLNAAAAKRQREEALQRARQAGPAMLEALKRIAAMLPSDHPAAAEARQAIALGAALQA